LALTRGRHPKPYRWTDPNEDVAAAVVGDRATLLVVADGHNGVTASEVAVRTVLEEVGDDPPAELAENDLVALYHRTGVAVIAAVRDADQTQRGSRTTLSIALVAGRRLTWAALGDSPVLVTENGQGMELTYADEPAFIGSPMTMRRVGSLLQRGRGTLGAAAWVAVTSDGFANFHLGATPAGSAAEVLAEAADATAAACGLLDHACAAGAGDNVAAAVAAPRG
jgi:serine/threonine protein phosphatase PrpC